jgi:hypothetical protein
MDVAALKAAARASAPQGAGEAMPLLIDGDALCYFCAGGDATDPEQAYLNIVERIRTAIAATAPSAVYILVTGSGSHKGHRYAVARLKPYQGSRTDKARPKNWQHLRNNIGNFANRPIAGVNVAVVNTIEEEADDLFARFSHAHEGRVWIFCQDKDMRMVPGYHLDWINYTTVYVGPDTWYVHAHDKVFGRAWFWSQMMHGDTADNIAGLPFYMDGSVVKSGVNKGGPKVIKVGDKWPGLSALPDLRNDRAAGQWALGFYMQGFQTRFQAMLSMAENGVLLWMRKLPGWEDVFRPGNPLYYLGLHPDGERAIEELRHRINVAGGFNGTSSTDC